MDSRGPRGQTETLGVVLLIGLTVISVAAMASFGGAVIDQTQDSVDVQRSEVAMTQLDAAAAAVAIGRTDHDTVPLGRTSGGTYDVRPDTGRIVITHHNYDDTGDSVELYNRSLGQVRYENDGTVLAYEGGGVWQMGPSGGTTMISPPAFDYNGDTLSMPVIRVDGSGSSAGATNAEIAREGSRTVYPTENRTYPGTEATLRNPTRNGTITIEVRSEFYESWSDYFRTRTSGAIVTDHDSQSVTLELVSTGVHGDFQVPAGDDAVELRSIGTGHPLDQFTTTVFPDQPESQEFNGVDWSLYAESGDEKYEVSIGSGNPHECGDDVGVVVYYANGSHKQTWRNDEAFEVSCDDVDNDGRNESHIDLNLTSDVRLDYSPVKSDLTKFNGNEDFRNPTTFDQHGATISWESNGGTTFHEGNTTTLRNVTNHYIGLLGSDVDLHSYDGNEGGGAAGAVDEARSTGYVQLGQSGNYVTYLYVSETTVTVTLR